VNTHTLISATLATLLSACGSGKADVQMLLTDAPADLALATAVNVTIDKVQLHVVLEGDGAGDENATGDAEEGKSGWRTVCSTQATFNLMELTGGKTAAMCPEAEIDSGKITQVRLMVSKAEIKWQDGSSSEVTIPSSEQTGIKIVGLARSLKEGEGNELTLDFDAKASIEVTASTSYTLKPTITLVE